MPTSNDSTHIKEIRDILADSSIVGTPLVTGESSLAFISVTSPGVVAAGKDYVSFALISGEATIEGTAMIKGQVIEFPAIKGKAHPELSYTVADRNYTDDNGDPAVDPGLLHILWGE